MSSFFPLFFSGCFEGLRGKGVVVVVHFRFGFGEGFEGLELRGRQQGSDVSR